MTKRQWMIRGGLLAVAALLAALAWYWSALAARARVGAAYGARITCSCRYVEGRDMGSCAKDKEPGMALVRLSDDPDARSVSASVPMLASARAQFRPGWGCIIDPAH